MSNQQAADRPDLPSVRAALIEAFSQEQLNLIGLWLGMEAIECNSEQIFRLGKQALGYADLKGSKANEFGDALESSH